MLLEDIIMKYKGIITEWNSQSFDTDYIGVVLITEDGQYIYGKEDKNFEGDNKDRIIDHKDIFQACLSELGISLLCDDQMEYAYSLVSGERNIVSLQIITVDSMKHVIIVMDLNSTSIQLDVLYKILRYFASYNFGFTGDICYGNARKKIYNEKSVNKIDVSIGFDDFWQELTTALDDLKGKKRSGK